MKRRELIKSAVLGGAAAAAVPAQHVHVKTIAPAQAAAAGGAWTPQVFDAHQNETVIQLTELIIPETDTGGGKAAKVNEYIDLMLHDVAEDKGHSFLWVSPLLVVTLMLAPLGWLVFEVVSFALTRKKPA